MYIFGVHVPEIFDKGLLSIGFGCLGILLLVVGHKLFHMLDLGKKLTRVDFKEQIKSGNTAAALYEGLVEAAFLVGLAYIVGQAIS